MYLKELPIGSPGREKSAKRMYLGKYANDGAFIPNRHFLFLIG